MIGGDWPANKVGDPTLGLVVGGAASWRDDLQALTKLVDGAWSGWVVAVNDAGTVLPGIHELCTLHHGGRTGRKNTPPAAWHRLREQAGLPPVPIVTIAAPPDGDAEVWRARPDPSRTSWTDGSSGLYAVARLLLHHRCTRIVLAGVRMDTQPNAFRDEARWVHHGRYIRGWQKRHARLAPVVRSMSGWTRETYGAPTLAWIASG